VKRKASVKQDKASFNCPHKYVVAKEVAPLESALYLQM